MSKQPSKAHRDKQLRERQEHIARTISEARERDSLLYVEFYCDTSADCAAREITVHVKDYDRTFVKSVISMVPVCPICRSPLKVHWVSSAREYVEVQERQARVSVNIQMRHRDNGDALRVECASWYSDDRLPPTPEGWFASGPRSAAVSRRRFVKKGDE